MGLMPHLTHHMSFWRQSYQPITWWIQKLGLSNQVCGWY